MLHSFNYIQDNLKGVYPYSEIKNFWLLVTEKLTGMSRTEIIINKNTIFSVQQYEEFKEIVEDLKNNVPIQYILGETEFLGLSFLVNSTVLIPRPETEELVEWIHQENVERKELNILDIGTGSGCIAISLKKLFPDALIDAFDISDKAIEVADLNAQRNGLNIEFLQADILSIPVFDKKWDIIVSNPPYIPEDEKIQMEPNVLHNEPHLALFVPNDDSLLFYRHIAEFAQIHLKEKGQLYFEIHKNAGETCLQLLNDKNFQQTVLRKDMAGNDRMIKAIRQY